MKKLIFVICVIISTKTLIYCFDSSLFNGLEEIDNVKISLRSFHNSKRSLTNHPDILYTNIADENRSIELRFEKNKKANIRPPIYLQSHGRGALHQEPSDECTGYYQSTDKSAHALVDTCNNGGDNVHVIAAEMVLNDQLHVLLPVETFENQTKYGIYRVQSIAEFTADYGTIKTDNTKAFDGTRPVFNRARRQTPTNVIEVLLVMDYSLYQFWLGVSDGSVTQAIDNISKFYGFVAQGVDARYRDLESYEIQIDTEVISVYILQTPSDSYLTENVDFTMSSRGVIDVETLLASFKTWVDDKKASDSSFPQADHYILMTARDVSLQGNRLSAGFAYIDTVCTSNSVSVVEDHFNFLSLTLIAHEIGHSLNGKHDSDVGCRNEDGYILSATNQAYTGTNAGHPWQFSNCSAQAFKDKLTALNADSSNCLRVNDATARLDASGTPPGQTFTPDEQCRFIYGPDSVMVRRLHDGQFDQICTGMYCTSTSVSSANLVIPADGTTCGNKKWCSNSQCVYSDAAPEADENCLFGDQPGQYVSGWTCAYTVATQLDRCYSDTVSKSCCVSCKANQLSITGCPYGDRSICNTINPANCYGETVAENCCKTCDQFSQQYSHLPAECKYGDVYVNCAPTLCSTYPTQCCETCYNAAQSSSSVTDTTRSADQTSKGATVTTRAPNTGSARTTTSGSNSGNALKDDELPEWVIPVAAVGGGLLLLIVIIVAAAYCCSSRNNSSKYKEKSSHHRNKNHDRGRHKDRHLRQEARHHNGRIHQSDPRLAKKGFGGWRY